MFGIFAFHVYSAGFFGVFLLKIQSLER